MNETKLGRREALSGGLAAVFTAAPDTAGRQGRGTANAVLTDQGEGVMGADARHAPFRAAFLTWLREVSGRFALPVSAHATSSSQTELHVPGLHPALSIVLQGDTDINIFVTWKDVCWDILASMDVYAELATDGFGWQSTLLIPEARRLHPTQEACWREDGFEWLLTWLNGALAPATHLALYGGEGCYEGDGWTAAHLVRDGLLLPSGTPLLSNGSLRELLPLHAIKA
jgi:hypothetical protein